MVYKGNYPHQIEEALEKRGVWKRYDQNKKNGDVTPRVTKVIS